MSSGRIAMHNAIKSPCMVAGMMAKGLCLCLLVVGCASRQVPVTDNPLSSPRSEHSFSDRQSAFAVLPPFTEPHQAATSPKRARFEQELKSANARRVADWVVDSGDNQGMPFLIIDKVDAKAFVFQADGRLRGAAAVLLGLSKGDDSVPGIGDRELSDIRPEERTTPAGRFIASLGRDWNGKDILWVDYDIALSLHRVITTNPVERRLERLNSPTPNDNRISFGCINVPVKFYDQVVKPVFTETYGVVYILPEVRKTDDIFATFYDVENVADQPQLTTSPKDLGPDVIDLILSLDPV